MKRSFIHAMLGLLICITSLQGVAAGLLACCLGLPGQHGVEQSLRHGGHGVEHAAASAASVHEAHAIGATAAHEAPPAHACSACIAGCSAAVLPDTVFALPLTQAGPRALAAAPAPVNHVPDTPERPPRIRAA